MTSEDEELQNLRALAETTAAQIAAKTMPGSVPKPPASAARPDATDNERLPAKRPRPPAKKFNGPLPPPPPPAVLSLGVADADEDPDAFEVVQVPIELIGMLIGKGGRGIRKIQAETGAFITIGKLCEDGVRKVCLTGSKASREKASEWIADFVANCVDLPVETIDVVEIPECFVREVIGHKGAVINSVRQASGVAASVENEAEEGADSKKLRLKGPQESVARAREQVERILLNLHRRQGFYNAPLEAKFKDKEDVSMPQHMTLPNPEDYLNTQAPASLQLPPQPADVEKTSLGGLLAMSPGQDFSQWPTPSSTLPPFYDDVLMWATYYANDAASVAQYMQLKRAGVPLGAAGVRDASVEAPLHSFG